MIELTVKIPVTIRSKEMDLGLCVYESFGLHISNFVQISLRRIGKKIL